MPQPADLTTPDSALDYYPVDHIRGFPSSYAVIRDAIVTYQKDATGAAANFHGLLTLLSNPVTATSANSPFGRPPVLELALRVALARIFQQQINNAIAMPQGSGPVRNYIARIGSDTAHRLDVLARGVEFKDPFLTQKLSAGGLSAGSPFRRG